MCFIIETEIVDWFSWIEVMCFMTEIEIVDCSVADMDCDHVLYDKNGDC